MRERETTESDETERTTKIDSVCIYATVYRSLSFYPSVCHPKPTCLSISLHLPVELSVFLPPPLSRISQALCLSLFILCLSPSCSASLCPPLCSSRSLSHSPPFCAGLSLSVPFCVTHILSLTHTHPTPRTVWLGLALGIRSSVRTQMPLVSLMDR